MAPFPPFAHFALTVTDLERSIAWYERLFEVPPTIVFPEDGYRAAVWLEPAFAIHGHVEGAIAGFDERRVGLDHVAFGCTTRAELEAWCTRLDDLGIAHGEIKDTWYGSGLAFRDPDGIALEFFVLRSGDA